MASIIKRKSKYSVVYYYEDTNGEKKQAWETFQTHKEALERKAEVEYLQAKGTFVPPSNMTIAQFMAEFVKLYGEKKWNVTTFSTNQALIDNYIVPLIGNASVQEVNTRFVDKYLSDLRKTKPVETKFRRATSEYVGPAVVEKVYKLLKCAFGMALRWELIGKNPFETAVLEKRKYAPRDIWTVEMIVQALNSCEDGKLFVAMNLDSVYTSHDRIASQIAIQRTWRAATNEAVVLA